jgi:RNA polymerase sigma factor (sigma-70 family)
MAQQSWDPILVQIRSLAARPGTPAHDAELLSQFVSRQDEAAFESLLRRHGAMVFRVAQRVLECEADAEDVFQATFLLLARRASAIRKREAVASWLHGVAHRLALSVRSKRARRSEKERRAAEARPTETPAESSWGELERALDEAIARLPARYRTPLVCCYLEGRTQEEVARDLGVPLGTVRSWVARGRDLLRKQLLRRGISLSVGGAGAALLASACARAEAVPSPLLLSTAKAACLYRRGGNAMAQVSPHAAALVRQGMTGVLVAKVKSGAASLLVLAFAVAGAAWAAHRGPSAEPQQAEESRPKAAASEDRPRADVHGDPLPPGAVARLGSLRFRHEDWINQCVLSPDGRTLAATAGKSVAFWDVATGKSLCRWTFPQEDVHCLAFTPDGKSVAVGGEKCIVHLLEVASGKETQRFAGHRPNHKQPGFVIFGVGFSADGRRLVSWACDKTVRVWETQSGKELSRMDVDDWRGWRLSPDGKLLAVRKGEEKVLRLWDVPANREYRQLALPADLAAVAFSPDSKVLAISTGDAEKPARIVLWDIDKGKELGSLTGHKSAVYGLAFSPDGKKLASGGYDHTMRLWDLVQRKEISTTPTLTSPVYEMTFSPDGQTLIGHGVSENYIRRWDVATWRERQPTAGPGMSIGSIVYSPDGELLASISGNGIWLWSLVSGELERKLEGHSGAVAAVMFSTVGHSLASASQDSTLRVWDLRTGKERNRVMAAAGFEQAALSPDGKMLAAWGNSAPQQIQLWRATGERLPPLDVPAEQPGVRASLDALCFSPDGKTLCAASGTHLGVLRWDIAARKVLPPLGKHDGGLNGISLSADGRSLAVITMGGSLYLWETATGQTRLIARKAGYATSVAFSPDGRLLALANAGNHRLIQGDEVRVEGADNREKVRLIRVADGEVVRSFAGHLGGIACVKFSPDGQTLASGGHDTTVLLWDVRGAGAPAKDVPPLQPEKLTQLWTQLSGTAAEAHRSTHILSSAPGQAVPFLGTKLKPIVGVDAARFAVLRKKLESNEFREREDAAEELKKLGDSAEPALRKALQENLSLETRRRLQALLEELQGGDRLRSLRAIEVLERIGDASAHELLRRLSAGAEGAWLTEEARTTLRRLERRDK